jgi:hypothetical protein
MRRRQRPKADCSYPAGGELSLSVCVAASSVLNRSGAGLRANDLASFLDQLGSTVGTQLQHIRAAHRVGMNVQPFVSQLCTALAAVSKSMPGAHVQDIADSVVQDICTAITSCASGSTRPIDSCCQFAIAVADRAYAKHVRSCRRTVRFAIEPADSDLNWHGVQSKVAGTTTLRGRPAATDVKLTLSLRLPWHTALDAIPYVLVHECVAHAFRGPDESTKDTGQGSEFAEGWMDRVALLLLIRAVRARPANGVPWPWNTVADLNERVTTASSERRAWRNPDPEDRMRSKWQVGHDAALAVEGSIRHLVSGGLIKAQDEFVRLSLLLNASGVSPADRDRLTRRIGLDQVPDLQAHMQTWLGDGLPPAELYRR